MVYRAIRGHIIDMPVIVAHIIGDDIGGIAFEVKSPGQCYHPLTRSSALCRIGGKVSALKGDLVRRCRELIVLDDTGRRCQCPSPIHIIDIHRIIGLRIGGDILG